jgi:transcription elongation factor GreA
MTPRGYAMLRRELKRLKAQRPEAAKAIEIARGHGDLSENADYDAAKERSGMLEARIRDFEAKLAVAEVIDPRKIQNSARVVFGTSIKMEDIESGEAKILSIVGVEEADVAKGWISFESPLARALIGKEVGDVAKVALPGGAREYEIQEIFVDYEEEVVAEAESEDA